MPTSKEELHRLIDRIEDPITLEAAYAAIQSIMKHDDQAWYWTERWQVGEQEADADKTAGRVGPLLDSAEELVRHFDEGRERRAQLIRVVLQALGTTAPILAKDHGQIVPKAEKILN